MLADRFDQKWLNIISGGTKSYLVLKKKPDVKNMSVPRLASEPEFGQSINQIRFSSGLTYREML